MNATACPNAPMLSRLLAGTLSAPEVNTFAAHLERCDPCLCAARALPEETLGEALRAAQGLAAVSAEAVRLTHLLTKLLHQRQNPSTVNSSTPHQPTSDGPAEASTAVAAATIIGRYRVIRLLGRGGMGTVYEAEDPQLRRRVAVKVPQFSGSVERQAQLRQRFLREARAAAAVDHPNVCKIYDVGEQDGKPFVVMAYVEGASLADRLPEQRRIIDKHAVALIVRIAEALMVVHQHGIVHRDLKPANILMTKEGAPILTDFGLAHVHADSEHLTGEGAILGTPPYMAPEQVVSDLGPVTTRTDLYSLAVMLFRMLTGRLPVEGNTMQIIAHHVGRKPIPTASQVVPGLAPRLDAVLRKAMAYRPEDRYPDVAAFAEALRDWLRAPAAVAGAAQPSTDVLLTTEPGPQRGPTPSTLVQSQPMPSTQAMSADPTLAQPRASSGSGVWLAVAVGLVLLVGGMAALGLFVVVGGLAMGMFFYTGTSQNAVQDQVAAAPVGESVNPKPKPGEPHLFIDEDFRSTFEKGQALPNGWTSDGAFAVVTDQERRPCLQVTKKTGDHFVTLPSMKLGSNFFIEGEYLLVADPFQGHDPHLTIQLESQKGGVRVPVVLNAAGGVTIGTNTLRGAPNFEVRKLARFRVVREGATWRVLLNNEIAAVAQLDEATEFDTVRIGLTAPLSRWPTLYNLKIGTLAP